MKTGDLGIAVINAIRIDDCCIILAGKLQSLPLVGQDRSFLSTTASGHLPSEGTVEHANIALCAARSWLSYKICSGRCSVWIATLEREALIDKRALSAMDPESLATGQYSTKSNNFSELADRSLWILRQDFRRLAEQILHERYGFDATFKLQNSARRWIELYPYENSKNAWAHYQMDVDYAVTKAQFDVEWRDVKGARTRGRPPKILPSS